MFKSLFVSRNDHDQAVNCETFDSNLRGTAVGNGWPYRIPLVNVDAGL